MTEEEYVNLTEGEELNKALRPLLAQQLLIAQHKGQVDDEKSSLSKVLEIGCGTGVFTELLADLSNHVTAVDVDDQALEAAKKRCSQGNNVTFRKYYYDFEEKSLDAVFFYRSLHFIDDVEETLNRLKRPQRRSIWRLWRTWRKSSTLRRWKGSRPSICLSFVSVRPRKVGKRGSLT